jgi:hypothetical protein
MCIASVSLAFERDLNRGEFHLEQSENVRASQQAQQGRFQELGHVPQNDRSRQEARTDRSDLGRRNLTKARANEIAKSNLIKGDEKYKQEAAQKGGTPWMVFAGLGLLFVVGIFGFKSYAQKNIPAMPERRKKKKKNSIY